MNLNQSQIGSKQKLFSKIIHKEKKTNKKKDLIFLFATRVIR